MSLKIKLLLAGSFVPTCAAMAQAPAPNGADSAVSTGVEEVVVTARKRDERLSDVPETITALSSETLERAGIKNLDDLGKALPNVVLNRRGDNEPNVVIRGIGAFGNVQGIGFYVDDVQNFTDQSARLVDLERIEVLKGPQGTLYGGSSIGGAVKYVTRKPSDRFEGKVSVEAGEQQTLNVNGSVNVPFGETVFGRFSAYTDNTDGYSRNSSTGVNNDESREVGVRAALRFLPAAGTDIVASLRWSDLDNGGNDYYATDSVRDYRYASPLSENIFNKREIRGGVVELNQQLSDMTLTSLTSYTSRRNRILWDLDYTAADGVIASQRKPLQSSVFTQELRLASNGDGPFNWLAGVYAARTKNRLLVAQADVTIGADFSEDGVPVVIDDFNHSSSLDRSYAGFFNLSYQIGALEIAAGARLNRNSFSATDYNIPASDTFEDTAVLPKVSLSYRLSPELMIYASGSKGYEPGKLNVVGGTLAPYQPETTTNYELGLKGELFGQLMTYELAAFHIENEDRQFETQVLDAQGVPRDLTANIGDSRSFGLEGAVTVRPMPELTLGLSAGYLDSEYQHAVFLLQRYDGNTVPYSPELTATASADYSVDLSSSLKFSARADVMHSGSFVWDIPNLAKQEAYQIVTLRIAVADIAERWELALRVQNLFDEGYNTEFLYNFAGADAADIVNGVCDDCHIARVGQPRLAIGTFTYRF